MQIIYESVADRLTSAEPPWDIGTDEARYIAKYILYMADAVQAHYKKALAKYSLTRFSIMLK